MHRTVGPPEAATKLISLFGRDNASHLLGDLSEEFNSRVLLSGIAAARRWYWREAMRTACWLAISKPLLRVLVLAPLAYYSTIFLAGWLATGLWRLLQWAAPSTGVVDLSRLSGAIILCSGFAGFLVGLITTSAVKQKKALRVAVICCFAGMSIWRAEQMYSFFHFPFPIRQRIYADFLLQLTIRLTVCAGSFWVGSLHAISRSTIPARPG